VEKKEEHCMVLRFVSELLLSVIYFLQMIVRKKVKTLEFQPLKGKKVKTLEEELCKQNMLIFPTNKKCHTNSSIFN